MNLNNPIEIAEEIYWVGSELKNDKFQCHVYFINNDDESILLDPGSRLTYPIVKSKIKKITNLKNIKYLICHHQDPDIVACVDDLIEDINRDDLTIITHWRAWALLKHYDWKIKLYEVEENGWKLKALNRRLEFIFTPYLHFPGAFCTYDTKTETLFSSDLFGGFTEEFELFAKSAEDYYEKLKVFHQHYMPSSTILNHGLDNIEKYPLKLIAPQHGSIIKEEFIKPIIKKMRNMECGIFQNFKYTQNIVKLSKLNSALEEAIKIIALQESFFNVVHKITKALNQFYRIESIKVFLSDDYEQNIIVLDSETDRVDFIEDKDKVRMLLNSSSYLKEGAVFYEPSILHSLLNIKDPAYIFPILDSDEKYLGVCFMILNPTQIKISEDLEILSKFETPIAMASLKERQLLCLKKKNIELFKETITDPLTELFNRRYIELFLCREFKRAHRFRHGLSLLMIDIDDFKKVNDTYGHDTGDRVLKKIAETIKDNIRSVDIAVRFGGEEFLVILPNTNKNEAYHVAKRIKESIENGKILYDAKKDFSLCCTVSIGVSSIEDNPKDIEELIRIADKRMYQAKAEGKNRVIG
ncbi:diguanylate cyclase [Hippea alviniae]|uniref:diguanylate cyclase n=1 Tax=Hippea alviniae TaxID=1279027 RepID=UPI0003B6E9AB|nr:diguanylate cyclase [Hippea alviniae]